MADAESRTPAKRAKPPILVSAIVAVVALLIVLAIVKAASPSRPGDPGEGATDGQLSRSYATRTTKSVESTVAW